MRVAQLKQKGLWSLKKLTRYPEPSRPKSHQDYLLEEMQWLAGDFAQERRWKRALAKKVLLLSFLSSLHFILFIIIIVTIFIYLFCKSEYRTAFPKLIYITN